uniref:Cytochrome P450 n=1 Tax=Kalanchoe fedtschenkoi TaxID=63787 RepID=A0A7N0TI33_KALFE
MALLPIFPPLAALLLLLLLLLFYRKKKKTNLPPGSYGWPVLGETLAFLSASRQGQPHKFALDRIAKHGRGRSKIFKTSLLGEKMVVFCGPSALKFLFSNENKLVNVWWPRSTQLLLRTSLVTLVGDDAKRVRRLLFSFLNLDALSRYIQVVDHATHLHITSQWQGKEELKVYPTVKVHTFELACRLFMSVDDPQLVSLLNEHFHFFLKGVISIAAYFPGTSYYRATKATKAIRKELGQIVRRRRVALEQRAALPTQDLLSYLLVTADEDGRFLTEEEIVSNILLLLFAGHDTSTCAITVIMKYLAEMPEVYDKVLEEQRGIASSKGPGDFLNRGDLQKMKYSWNVISEVMRLTPPVTGSYRQAIADFDYEGYTIPKGFKIMWSAAAHHRDPSNFPDEANFDPSRFEGAGLAPYAYVPFGGGPRMCLGLEFARLETLVFLHHLVTSFRWEMMVPGEKVIFDPMPVPAEELPIRLRPHTA